MGRDLIRAVCWVRGIIEIHSECDNHTSCYEPIICCIPSIVVSSSTRSDGHAPLSILFRRRPMSCKSMYFNYIFLHASMECSKLDPVRKTTYSSHRFRLGYHHHKFMALAHLLSSNHRHENGGVLFTSVNNRRCLLHQTASLSNGLTPRPSGP